MLNYMTDLWSVLGKQWRFVARDAGGRIYAYTAHPARVGACFQHVYGKCSEITALDIDPATIPTNWEHSLIERPYQWRVPDEHTPVDTPVFVRDSVRWYRRLFAQQGRAFADGGTSWSSSGITTSWKQIVLADPDNPNRQPPHYWKPEKE
jgi:hypothetical protein